MLEQGFLIRKTYNEPRSSIWNYYTTTPAPDLPSAKRTYINILSDIAPDGVHSSSFATDYETHFAVSGGGFKDGKEEKSSTRAGD